MNKIEQISSNAEFSKPVSMKMKLAWLANNRHDIVLEIAQVVQVARAMYQKDMSTHCKRLNKGIKYVNGHKASIRIPKLDYNWLRITAYSNAAFSNNADLSSQHGQIILLTADNHNAIPVSCKLYKLRRAARPVLSVKVIAFADLFNDTLAIRKQLEFHLRKPIPEHILTES